MPNKVDIVVSGTNRSGQTYRQATDDTRKLGDTAKTASRDVDKLGDALDDVGKNADGAAQKGEKFGSRLGGALKDQAGEGVDGLLGKLGQTGAVLGKLGPIGIGVGAVIGAALGAAALAADKLKDAIGKSIERTAAGAQVAAQLGLDKPEQVARLGKLAGAVYADNFGASLEDAATAVRDVIRTHLVPEDATDAFVKGTAEKLSTVAGLFEDSTSRVAVSVQQLLRTGLAKSADEALDVLTRGLQEGGDKAEDLLDTFNEYPTQLRKLGLSAEQSLGLLLQGLRAGARDSDIVADALKEFSIRAVDGSKTTADGFKRLGLNGKQMAEDIAAGGQRANTALDRTLDRLRAVKDPVQQAQIAVELFGTQAEDLGKALFALDPSNAVNAVGKVAGATDRASAALSTGLGPQLEAMHRRWDQFKADIGDRAAPVVQKIIDKLGQLYQSVLPALHDALDFVKRKWDENQDSIEKFRGFLHDIEPFIKGALVVAIGVLAGAIGLLIQGISNFGDNWDRAKIIVGKTVGPILQYFSAILDGAVAAFGWIPGIGDKLKTAQKQFETFKKNVNNSLAGISDRTVHVSVGLFGIQGLADKIRQVVGAEVIASGIGHRASGGAAAGLTVINEAGQEAVRLPTGSIVYPHGQSMGMAGAATAVVVKVVHEIAGNADSQVGSFLAELQQRGVFRVYASAIIANR